MNQEDEDDLYVDRKGLCYCRAHRREVCHECCVDHRVTNQMTREGPGADLDEIIALNARQQEIEIAAMAAEHAARGQTGPLRLGSEEAAHLYEAVAAPPPSGQRQCAHCSVCGDKLAVCARCKAAYYCCREHQLEHYPQHKQACRTAAAGASHKDLVSWLQLERLQGVPAEGKTLEVRILSQPVAFLRHICEAKDHKGTIRRLAFYCDDVPWGLALGAVLRWRNPHFHCFLDGSRGARIEDEDLPNISVVQAAGRR